ncbi:MAG: hypothetical protein KKF46_04305 [Nanoarchaeota archaeon]|nr:hypothetical protein [Nanoarchaeota archaeon]MBU1321558.1 hypothetical protein [Nanoarchaeota archaeon]MBU1597092.1 hypothetical protein [Nanoarchaeota archaeon]MBU2441873.1 hypothetical protein [Nanoarchaeota archaeon]
MKYAKNYDAQDYSNFKENSAREVARLVGDEPSLIIGLEHYNITFCYNQPDVDLVTFDAHKDSFFPETNYPEFTDGSFLRWRKGKTYILGAGGWTSDKKIKGFSKRRINKVLKENLSDKIFLSLEIDVFNENVTTAHHCPDESFFRKLGFGKRLDYDPVSDLSKELIKNRNLAGINIAGYDPLLDKPGFKTAEMLKDYLDFVLLCETDIDLLLN